LLDSLLQEHNKRFGDSGKYWRLLINTV